MAAAERLVVFAGQDKNARVNVDVIFNDAKLVSPDPPHPMRSYTFAWDFDTTKDLNLDGIYDNDNESTTLLTEYSYWYPAVYTVTLTGSNDIGDMAKDTLLVTVRDNQTPAIIEEVMPDGLQDERYNFTFRATDPDNAAAELSWSDDSPLFKINGSGGIGFRPENEDVGYHSFNITVSDPGGLNDTQGFTLFIANVNDPPALRYIPPKYADEDTIWTFDVSRYVNDPDLLLSAEFRDRITYRDDTPKLETNLETGIVTWDMPQNEDVGDFYFKITVQDSKGRYAESEVKIIVNNTNDEPKLGSIQRQTLHQDAQYVYTVPATDDDLSVPSANEELTFTNDRTELFTIDAATGRISFTPVNIQVGVWEVNITVTDIEGATATKKVVFGVINKNDPPDLEYILMQSLIEDVPYEYQVVATDPDMESRLVDRLPVDPSEKLEFRTNSTKVPIDRDTGLISFMPTQAEVGEFVVKITVIDSSSEAKTADVLFKVANVNDPPRMITPDVIQATEDVAYGVVYRAEDTDTGDELVWSFASNASWLSFDQRTGSLSGLPTDGDVGTYYVNLTVTDAVGAIDSRNFTLRVLNVNDPPTILTNDVLTATEDVPYQVEYWATDPDAGDTFLWVLETDAHWLHIDTATGVISGLPTGDDVGRYNVKVTVTDDSDASDSHEFTVTVASVNHSPVITGVAPANGTKFDLGEAITFEATASDPDGDTLTYLWRADGFELGGGDRFTTRSLKPGRWTITLIVDDGNATTERQLEITVRKHLIDAYPPVVLYLTLVAIAAAGTCGVLLYIRKRRG